MKTLIEEYYGHIVKVEFNSSPKSDNLELVPDSVKEVIFNNMADDVTDGEFTEDETGEEYSGRWSFQPLDFNLMKRIAAWNYHCVHETEGLTLEKFRAAYGSAVGAYFYEKWRGFRFDFFKMIRYFNQGDNGGQIFCSMLMECVEEYEKQKYTK